MLIWWGTYFVLQYFGLNKMTLWQLIGIQQRIFLTPAFNILFFKQVLSLFLSAFLVILHVMLYSLGSSNYSFSVSIMGRSASWVFRKLHGNSFIVKCSINACSPPPPQKSDVPAKGCFFRKYRKVVTFGSLRSLLLQSLLRELDALHTAGSLHPEVLEKL